MKIAIYLAGGIKKAHENPQDIFWTQEDMEILKNQLPQHELYFLNPASRTDDLSDQHSVFGRDMLQVFTSDLVFVDARSRRGLGVGAEMMWAKMHRIPVITLAPQDTFYKKSRVTILDVTVENWIHPFIISLSDKVVDNLLEGANWIEDYLSGKISSIRGPEWMESAMRYYVENQLETDLPLQKLLATHEKLITKFPPILT